MIIRKYGIELHRLREQSDVELVRTHRNSAHVRQGMFFQDMITPEMQQNWFASQNNKSNYHFIINFEGRKSGLISGKNVDFHHGNSEGGIFIWDQSSLGTPIPVIASVIMAELTFNLLGLSKTYAETRNDNKPAMRYNYLLGYDVLEEIEHEKKVMLVLTSENFKKRGERFLHAIRTAAKDLQPLSWDDIDLGNINIDERETLYKGFPPKIQACIDRRFL